MEQKSIDTHKKPLPAAEESASGSRETSTENYSVNNSAEVANSNSSASDLESESSTVADIVTEVRELYTSGTKVDVLIQLIQSRTVEVRYKRQLQVYQVALHEGIKEKTRLQLDLAYCEKMLTMLERGAQESKRSLATVVEHHSEAVKMIEALDGKRTQLLKEEQAIKTELAEYKQNFLKMQQEMANHAALFESVTRRYDLLQAQVDKLTGANEVWQKKVCDSEAKQRSMVSAHSAQLNDIENLLADYEDKLKVAQCQADSEKRTNTLLKEHMDMVLQEKTQLLTDLASAENRIATMEADFARKMTELQANYKATIEKESSRTSEKMAEMIRSAKEITAEKDLLVAKLAQQMNVTEEMEAKLGGMQVILDDRNNEILSLQSKLNCELKRHEELKQQQLQGTTEAEERLSDLLKESTEKETQIKETKEKLEEARRNQANTLSAFNKQLKEKDLNVAHYMAEITRLENELEAKSAQVAQLEQLAREERQVSTATENMPARTTSTPISVDEQTSYAAPAAKKSRIPDSERGCTSPSYTNFHGSVQRRSFFKRTASATSQVSIANTNVSYSQIISNMNLNLSMASTVNVDDEPIDLGDISGISMATTSVRQVKPFFRRLQEK